MSTINDSLFIGYSGLTASQVGIATTGHNISNAEAEGYTRQRVITQAAYPTGSTTMNGNGTQVKEIERVFDRFVYDRYLGSSENYENAEYKSNMLNTEATYFPDINDSGIKKDMHDFFDTWQSLSNDPNSAAIKVTLSQQTQTLTQNITNTRENVKILQETINDDLKLAIDNVNAYAEEIAAINLQITKYDADPKLNPNDLYDRRDNLQLKLTKLVGAIGIVEGTDPAIGTKYNVQVSGFNIVDGTAFHEIKLVDSGNASGFYDLAYERQDGRLIPMDIEIRKGEVGAMLDLRGRTLDPDTGIPTSGMLQETINELDTLAAGIIEGTNNIYARSATSSMQSNELDIDPKIALMDTSKKILEGTFDVIVYDSSGTEVSTRTITIDQNTLLTGIADSNSIEGQFLKVQDDNGDGVGTNDIDDMLTFTYDENSKKININFKSGTGFEQQGYLFAIEDKTLNGTNGGTNFAGAFELNRFFKGSDASDMAIEDDLKSDPTLIHANGANKTGNNDVALDMIQLQFEDVTFRNGDTDTQETIYGYYDATVTKVGSQSRQAEISRDTIAAQLAAITQEYSSVSKVSIDEELTNLIKYQTSFGAAAKVITTIDQMMDTLLGLKR
ncbi:MAG: flagellar hook-associated protein FlgK [Helicobacteraceae bacterium]|nr:flagellar hook-associated protein FlgK [Helicobacteraceae bacterium]